MEFSRWPEIERAYGASGIRLAAATGTLVVSDDTQMTLFTLEGMARVASTNKIVDEVRDARGGLAFLVGFHGPTESSSAHQAAAANGLN